MTQSLRTTLSLITLNCALLFGLSMPTQAQGLKTNSGSFGSGWQVGSAGADTAGGYGAAGSSTSTSGSTSGPYGSYGGESTGSGAASNGSGSYGGGAYGGYSSTYGASNSPAANQAPAGGTGSPYSAPRSAGGGLRAQ